MAHKVSKLVDSWLSLHYTWAHIKHIPWPSVYTDLQSRAMRGRSRAT